MKIEKPTLLLGEEVKQMNNSVGVASKILKFSNDRKNLTIENYLEEHAKIIAAVFDTTAEEVKSKVPFALLITKFFDCLEYTAKVICNAADQVESRTFGKGRG